jgi:phosphoribosylanthranilate isomerase
MSLIVKICGLSTGESLDAALDAGAEMIGLNFFPKSPRFVSLEVGRELAARARGHTEVVALAVDMDEAGLAEIIAAVRPDWLQLHGSESPETVAAVRHRFGLKVMKALPVAARSDLDQVAAYTAVADRLLLDAKPPKGADRPGGHGRTFDWTILAEFHPAKPYLLSGGLAPANIGEAIRITGAPGVDVSSGVETAPGRKDPDLIRAFVAAARHASISAEPARAAS